MRQHFFLTAISRAQKSGVSIDYTGDYGKAIINSYVNAIQSKILSKKYRTEFFQKAEEDIAKLIQLIFTGNLQPCAAPVPARTFADQYDVGTRCGREADLLEMFIHGLGIGTGHDHGRSGGAAGTDRAKKG